MSSLTYHGEQLLFPQTRTLQALQRAVRSSQHSLRNRLLSIHDDILFLHSLLPLYPPYPVLPNLSCGAWYHPPPSAQSPSATQTPARSSAAAYFKSTDGHCGHWKLSSVRLNVAVVEAAAEAGGCWLVDSTRQGKRWPDSFSRTVPIWCAVVNRAVQRTRQRAQHNAELQEAVVGEDEMMDWDELCMPDVVSDSEAQQVEQLMPEFVNTFINAAGSSTLIRLARILTRPLRPVYIDRSTPPPSSPAEYANLPYLPLLLCNPSVTEPQHERRGWTYIQGAADDAANWARGLLVDEWWTWREQLVSAAGPMECEALADEIVAQRKMRLANAHGLDESKQGQELKHESGTQETKAVEAVGVDARAVEQSGLLIARAAQAPSPQCAGVDAVLYLRVMHGKGAANAMNRTRRQAIPDAADSEEDEAQTTADHIDHSSHSTVPATGSSSSAFASHACSPSSSPAELPPTSYTISVSGLPKDKRSLQDILPAAITYVTRCRALGWRVLVASSEWGVAAGVCIGCVVAGCNSEYEWVGEGGVGVLQSSVSKTTIRVVSNAVYELMPSEFVSRLQLKQINRHFLT